MLEIRLARTPEEREQIFKLRYQVYVEELGWFESCPNYQPNHEQQKVEDPLDASANLFMALNQNESIGSLRCNYAKNLDSDYYIKLYQISEKAGDVDKYSTSITSRLVVPHHFRGKRISLKMLEASYKQQLLDGIKYDFIDCETQMITFFEKLGYQSLGTIDYEVYGSGTLMVLDVFNFKHLEKVRSPLLREYKNFLDSKI